MADREESHDPAVAYDESSRVPEHDSALWRFLTTPDPTRMAIAKAKEPAYAEKVERGRDVSDYKEHLYEQWQSDAKEEEEDLRKQLNMPAGDTEIPMIDDGSKLGVDVSRLEQKVALKAMDDESYDKYHVSYDALDKKLEELGVDNPEDVKASISARAHDKARRQVGAAFTGKRHLSAFLVDDDKLMKEIDEIPGSAGVFSAGISPQEFYAIGAPKTFTVLGKDGVTTSLTGKEVRSERWGDYLKRLMFDSVPTILASRVKSAGKHQSKAGEYLYDGEWKKALDEHLASTAAMLGEKADTPEEREAYIRMLRSNPDLLQHVADTFRKGAEMTAASDTIDATPENTKRTGDVAAAIGHLMGFDMIAVSPDAFTVGLSGTTKLVGEGLHLIQTRKALFAIKEVERVVNGGGSASDAVSALKRIDPALADVVEAEMRAATRGDNSMSSAIGQLKTDAGRLADEAAAASKKAAELEKEYPETVKAAGEAIESEAAHKQALADQTAKALAKEHRAKLAESLKAKAAAKTAESAKMTKQAELLEAKDALTKSKAALEEYIAGSSAQRKALTGTQRSADKIEESYTKAQAAAEQYYKDNRGLIDSVAEDMVASEEKTQRIMELETRKKQAEEAATTLRAQIDELQKQHGKVDPGYMPAVDAARKEFESGKLKLADYTKRIAEIKKEFDPMKGAPAEVQKQLKTANSLLKRAVEEQSAAISEADKLTKELKETTESIKQKGPEAVKAWKELLKMKAKAKSLADEGAALVGKTGGLGIGQELLEHDSKALTQLKAEHASAIATMKRVSAEYGGVEKALKEADKIAVEATKAADAARGARLRHSERAISSSQAMAQKAAAARGKAAAGAVEDIAATKGKVADKLDESARKAAQSEAWKAAALRTVRDYAEGLKRSRSMRAQMDALTTSKSLITDGVDLHKVAGTADVSVRNTDMLKKLTDLAGPGGLGILAKQETPLGDVVRKLINTKGTWVVLSPAEISTIQRAPREVAGALLRGSDKYPQLLTHSTVQNLDKIEHTKATSWSLEGIRRRVTTLPQRLSKSFGPGYVKLGAVEEQLPEIIRAMSNKTAQANDELAYLHLHGKWKDVSEDTKKALTLLGIDASADEKGAVQAGLIIDYLDTTRPLPYGPGATLQNTSTLSGRSIFWQFRHQALNDARVASFVEELDKLPEGADMAPLIDKFADTSAPHLVGMARTWFPSTTENVNPHTAAIILRDMMEELKSSYAADGDFVHFMAAMKKRTAAPTYVGTDIVRDGEVIAGSLRPRSQTGLGGTDTNIVRVMGFTGSLVSHGSNLYETDAMLAKAVGGVIDTETMRHVDAFLSGAYSGVDGKPVDMRKVMDFFGRAGLPMTADRQVIRDWAGNVGERTVAAALLGSDPKAPVWATKQLVEQLDSELGNVAKRLEGRTRFDGPIGANAQVLVNVWRRSVTTGYLLPNPSFWTTNWLGNVTQAWTVLGPEKALQGGIDTIAPNIPLVGKFVQDFMSRQADKAAGKAVIGPVMEWLFNPHIAAVANGEQGFVKFKSGLVMDYATIRRNWIDQGVVDTMLREELTDVFSRRDVTSISARIPRWLSGESAYHRTLSDFQTMTQQRARMSLWLRLVNDGHQPTEAGKLVNDAYFDWKHGAPPIKAFMALLPFWRFTALGHRQAFRALMQGMYDPEGAMKAAMIGQSQLGHMRQQLYAVSELENLMLPSQQGPYASQDEKTLALATDESPMWYSGRTRMSLQVVDDATRRQLFLDSGKDKPYALYSLPDNTTLGFVDVQIGLAAALGSHLYAGAYGDAVEPLMVQSVGELTGEAVDKSNPWLSEPMHTFFNSIGLDPDSGQESKDQWGTAEKALVARHLAGKFGIDPDKVAYQPEDGHGRWRIKPIAAVLTELPGMNNLTQNYARFALNPYRLQDDPRAVKSVTYIMTKMMGTGPNYYSPETRLRELRSDAERKLKAVDASTRPTWQGFDPADLDKKERAR